MKPIIFSAFLLLTTQAFADAAADVPADPKLNGYPPYAKVVLRSILDEYPPYSDLIVQFGVLYNVADDPASLPVFGYDVSESTALVPIPTDLVVCQAFRDIAGRDPLGGPFVKPPFFGNQRFSNSNPPIRVGSIFCSDAAAVQAYLSSRPADGNPTVRAIPRPYVTVLLGVGFSFYDVNKQVLADGTVTPITLPNNETSGYIYFGTGVEAKLVSCQLYEDEGTKKTGKALSTFQQFDIRDEGYVASKVKTIRCRQTSL